MRICMLAAVLIVAVGGCSKSDTATETAAPSPQEKESVLFKQQIQQLEKAKGVEETLQQGAQHLDESLEKQEGTAH